MRGEYREYHRDFRQGRDSRGNKNGRDIKTATTRDFLDWPDPVWLNYSPGRTSELYTNQVNPYYRAPHIYLGFPTRYIERGDLCTDRRRRSRVHRQSGADGRPHE